MNLVICDICGTLVHENTTRGFLGWLSRRGVRSRVIAAALSRPVSWLSARTGVDISRRWLIGSLRGMDRERLMSEAEAYVDHAIGSLGRTRLLGELSRHLAAGGRLILASATLDPIATAFANRLGAHGVVSSRLSYGDDGRCRGSLQEDLTGRKWPAIQPLIRSMNASHVTLHTDNGEDLDVMQHADRVFFYGHPPAKAVQELGPGRLTTMPQEER